jgi:hypothetical protein
MCWYGSGINSMQQRPSSLTYSITFRWGWLSPLDCYLCLAVPSQLSERHGMTTLMAQVSVLRRGRG